MWNWPRVAVVIAIVAGCVACAIVGRDAIATGLLGLAGGLSMPGGLKKLPG